MIKVYVTYTYKAWFKNQARVRALKQSQLGRVAFYDFFNPKLVPITRENPIVRIDRTPKGMKSSPVENDYREVMRELKEGYKLVKRYSDDEVGIKVG